MSNNQTWKKVNTLPVHCWQCAFSYSLSSVFPKSIYQTLHSRWMFTFKFLNLTPPSFQPPGESTFSQSWDQWWTVAKSIYLNIWLVFLETHAFYSTTFQRQTLYFWLHHTFLKAYLLLWSKALKPAVLGHGMTIVFFCFIELILLKAVVLVQFGTGQCICIVMTLDSRLFLVTHD